jgi:alpha-L-rhamnosidase
MAGQTQTGYILALYFDLVPDDLRPAIMDALVKDIVVARKTHMSTGFVGTPYINQVLTDIGRVDLAYALLLQKTFPSWLYSVLHGATTIWERWDGWTEEKGFQDPGMNSFNHYAYGAVGTWIVENILGIRSDPEKPGFKHILLHPKVGGGLTFASGEYQSPYGVIRSHWQIENGAFLWDVVIPPNTTATAFIPAEGQTQILEGEFPVQDSPGVTHRSQSVNTHIFEIQSGTYKFTVIKERS